MDGRGNHAHLDWKCVLFHTISTACNVLSSFYLASLLALMICTIQTIKAVCSAVSDLDTKTTQR